MKTSKLWSMTALILIVALPAYAGHGKCDASTQECLDYMATKMKDSGWVGVELEPVEENGPMKVTKVVEGSPAEEAGIQPGDVLYAMNGIQLSEENEEKLMKARMGWKPGASVTWTMKRNDNDRKVAITLAPMPANVLAAYIGQHMMEHATVDLAANTN